MTKYELTNILKDYVSPKLLDEAVEKVLNFGDSAVQINRSDDIVNIGDINENTPDGTRFMRNGRMYRITRAHKRCCEMYECGAACKFYNVCEQLPFGFELVM